MELDTVTFIADFSASATSVWGQAVQVLEGMMDTVTCIAAISTCCKGGERTIAM